MNECIARKEQLRMVKWNDPVVILQMGYAMQVPQFLSSLRNPPRDALDCLRLIRRALTTHLTSRSSSQCNQYVHVIALWKGVPQSIPWKMHRYHFGPHIPSTFHSLPPTYGDHVVSQVFPPHAARELRRPRRWLHNFKAQIQQVAELHGTFGATFAACVDDIWPHGQEKCREHEQIWLSFPWDLTKVDRQQ